MSFDDLRSGVASDGRPPTETVDVELDITSLDSLVAESDETPADDSELSELLAHIDSADAVASGVEAKLDGILGTLDDLLTSLELKDSDKPQEAAIPRCESQSKCPPSEGS